jgi:hypothetical protein
MRNKLIALLCLLLIGSVAIFFLFNKKPEVHPPVQVSNIPSNAKWVGGVDGGNWYQIKKVLSPNVFRIAIYNESSGDIEVDTTFTLNPLCILQSIDSLTLVKSINGYDGEKVLLTLPEKDKRCFLIVK